MKPIRFSLCSLYLLSICHALAESPKQSGDSPAADLSLSAVTDSVLAHNPAIKAARAQWEALKQRVPQAAAWDDLKIGGSTRLGRFVDVAANSFTDQMLSVEQMIPISGKNRSRERIAAAEALAAWEAVRRKELDAVAKARAAYYRLARDYALLELNRANESSLTQTVEITRAKLEVGNQGQTEVLVAENEVNRLEESRHDLMRSISEDGTELKVLMNRDPFGFLGKPEPLPLPGSEHLAAETLRVALLNNRPEVRGSQADLAAAKAKLELAKREWIPDPTVSVEAQRYNGAAQGVSEIGAGISFHVPWLNARKYRAEEREAQSGVEAAQQALESARTLALGLLSDQLQKIETARRHIELCQTHLIPNARQTVQTNHANYEGGKASFLDLVLSERNLREREAMFQQHLADYQIAIADLAALLGLGAHADRRARLKRRVTMTKRSFISLATTLSFAALLGCQREGVGSGNPNVDYYTCTMHPSVHSHDPKAKCPSCGMDLVPVWKKGVKSEASPAAASGPVLNEFSVPVERQQQIGVTYATIRKHPLRHVIRAVGTVASDRTRHWEVVARVEGYVQKLYVTSPGEPVAVGQPLLAIYSPELSTAERELVNLLDARDRASTGESKSGAERSIEAARRRLEQWNISASQIAELEKTRKPSEFLTLDSPSKGVVENVPVDQGRKVLIGDRLVDVADLSVVWVWAEFFEDELSLLEKGQKANVTATAYPGKTFEGTLGILNPFAAEAMRTTKVRIDISNPEFRLRPGMYVNVELMIDRGEGLAIPVSAVKPTGSRALVFVDKGEGKLEPRLISLGRKFGDIYQVLGDLKEGERVVASANFLIDAESKVQGAVKSFEAPTPSEATP